MFVVQYVTSLSCPLIWPYVKVEIMSLLELCFAIQDGEVVRVLKFYPYKED